MTRDCYEGVNKPLAIVVMEYSDGLHFVDRLLHLYFFFDFDVLKLYDIEFVITVGGAD